MAMKKKRDNLGLSGTRPYYSHDGAARKSEKDAANTFRIGSEGRGGVEESLHVRWCCSDTRTAFAVCGGSRGGGAAVSGKVR